MNRFFERTSFEPVGPKGDWRPELPPSVQRAFADDPSRCGKCGTKENIGTNEDEKVFCQSCWGEGGCGFAWWRL